MAILERNTEKAGTKQFHHVGKRKRAVARVYVRPRAGETVAWVVSVKNTGREACRANVTVVVDLPSTASHAPYYGLGTGSTEKTEIDDTRDSNDIEVGFAGAYAANAKYQVYAEPFGPAEDGVIIPSPTYENDVIVVGA